MSEINFSISLPDTSALGGLSIFSPFFEWIATNKAPLEKEIKRLLTDYARDGHRELSGRHYQNQTGRLRKSTKAEGTFGADLKKEITLYVDLTQADYGKYVINPNPKTSWDGDPFIDETMKVMKPVITKKVIDFFNKAILEFNRR